MPDPVVDDGAEVSDGMSDNDNEYDDGHLDEDDRMIDHAGLVSAHGPDGILDAKKKHDAKNPVRQKRKKARRACYACQRAHLTCGEFQTTFSALVSVFP
jgi:hypothetical protein